MNRAAVQITLEWYTYGLLLEDKGLKKRALDCYLKAWRSAPREWGLMLAAFYIARLQAQPETALKWHEMALQKAEQLPLKGIRPFLPALYEDLARTQENLDSPATAAVYYRRALGVVDFLPELIQKERARTRLQAALLRLPLPPAQAAEHATPLRPSLLWRLKRAAGATSLNAVLLLLCCFQSAPLTLPFRINGTPLPFAPTGMGALLVVHFLLCYGLLTLFLRPLTLLRPLFLSPFSLALLCGLMAWSSSTLLWLLWRPTLTAVVSPLWLMGHLLVQLIGIGWPVACALHRTR